MANAGALGGGEREAVEGSAHEERSEAGEELHAPGGGGEGSELVELIGVDGVWLGRSADLERGEAVGDLGALGHAEEDGAGALILKHAVGEVDEGVVDVVVEGGSGDAFEEGWGRHAFLQDMVRWPRMGRR